MSEPRALSTSKRDVPSSDPLAELGPHEMMAGGDWLDAEELDDLVSRCARILFALCRADHRGWMSESDLQCLFHHIARKELAAQGLHASAVHADYVFRLQSSGDQGADPIERAIPVDIALVVPESIHILRGRHWEARVASIIEVKRGHERHREIEHDLAKLATIAEARPHLRPHMLVMGYRSKLEDMAIVERMAHAHDILLLHDNYWGMTTRPSQLELVT